MRTASIHLIVRWIAGAAVGTLVIALTSPWFVRSYLPLQVDAVRGVWTLSPKHTYRWRSEGYADTQIGPLGMPGKSRLPGENSARVRVALWGDSQAEGVCVADSNKLYAQIQRATDDQWNVFPLARSGEDAAVWVTQMPAIESHLSVDCHVMLIVDLPDLPAATAAPIAPPSSDQAAQANSAIAARLPAFVIQGARNLLTESDQSTRRQLRFSIGPVPAPAAPTSAAIAAPNDWPKVVASLRKATDLPIVILYAPILPRIAAGNVIDTDPNELEFSAMKSAAEAAGLIVLDLRQPFRESMESGVWPHGFHNGHIGSGHLNERGYAIIAHELANRMDALPQEAR